MCPDTLDEFIGGGIQMRFRDFDKKWIIETRELSSIVDDFKAAKITKDQIESRYWRAVMK